MNCCHENPKYRQKLEAGEAIERIFGAKKGSDWDIDIKGEA